MKFKLYGSENGSKSGDALKFTAGDGTYKYDSAATSTDADMLTTNASGLITVTGLTPGIYWLEETSAANGYNKLTSLIKVDLSGTSGTASIPNEDGSGSISGTPTWSTTASTPQLQFTLTNKPGYELPSLGASDGWNIWVYIIAAVAFLATILMQRKHAERS